MLKPMLFLFVYLLHKSIQDTPSMECQQYLQLQSVKIFREYIRIDTSEPENLQKAVNFWRRQMIKSGIPYRIYKPAGKPIFVATLKGTNSSLPSIMLNSHMDVVKADASEWKYPPFSADVDEDCNIYGRGTQDTKDLGIQYFEALKRLKKDKVKLARTLHMTLMPDEEIRSEDGMKAFIKSGEFKSLNVGFALDEGVFYTEGVLFGTYWDKRPWQMQFVINGEGGHGSSMPDNTAVEKTQKFINTVMAYRETQKEIMGTKNLTDFTGYSSLNINILKAGLAQNIIPTKVELTVDMRLSTDANVTEMEAKVQSWMDVAGNDTELTYFRKETESGITAVNDSNPFWISMQNTLNGMGIPIIPIVCPGTTDMLMVRNIGVPAIGFTPKRMTMPHVHGEDEYQNAKTFVEGIDIYTEVIKNLANVRSIH